MKSRMEIRTCQEGSVMVRKGFKMFLYPGMEQEYKRRHNLLWPEMKEMIR